MSGQAHTIASGSRKTGSAELKYHRLHDVGAIQTASDPDLSWLVGFESPFANRRKGSLVKLIQWHRSEHFRIDNLALGVELQSQNNRAKHTLPKLVPRIAQFRFLNHQT